MRQMETPTQFVQWLRSVAPYEPGDRTILREFQREYFGDNSRQADERFADEVVVLGHEELEQGPLQPPLQELRCGASAAPHAGVEIRSARGRRVPAASFTSRCASASRPGCPAAD